MMGDCEVRMNETQRLRKQLAESQKREEGLRATNTTLDALLKDQQESNLLMFNDMRLLREERDGLRERIAEWRANYETLQQENARLREALRFLRNHTSVSSYQIECIDQALAAKEKT